MVEIFNELFYRFIVKKHWHIVIGLIHLNSICEINYQDINNLKKNYG